MSLFVRDDKPMSFYIKTFKGKKELSKMITENGGVISSTRAPANLCLAHPETESVVGDFYSIEFIKDCIENGSLLETDSYKLNTSPPSPQVKERTLFTSKDHALLRQALKDTKHSPYGNQLYQELEKSFPHHTWQSWKDYSIKKYLPNIEPLNDKEQENIVLEIDQSIVPKDGEENAPHETLKDSTEYLNQVSNISKENLKRRLISEDDKSRINQFLASFNKLCEEYDLWDKQDIMTAMFMASGSIQIAKKILSAGFNLQDLDYESRSLVYTIDDDKMIINHQSTNKFQEMIKTRGRESVQVRLLFLSNTPSFGADLE